MGLTDEDKKRLKGGGSMSEPEYARIPDLCSRFGLSRSAIYKLAGEGKIRLLKYGNTTIGDCSSVRQHMASLPKADIRCGQSRVAA